jgi:hypothetical protein
MKARIAAFGLSLVAALELASCSMCGVEQDAQAIAEAMQAAAQAAQQGQQMQQPGMQQQVVDPDAALFEKLGGYIDCYNASASTARDSYNRYLDWVNKKKGPNCKETYISYGLFEIGASAVQTCNAAVQKGAATPPPIAADAAAAQVATVLSQLQPINDKAEAYYEAEDYKDDNCALAKSSHAQLISLFDQFLVAVDSMKLAVDQVKDEADLRQLALLERTEGRKFSYHVKKTMIYAKKLVDIYPEGQNPKKVKKEAYLPLFAAFEPVYKEFETYAAANKAEIDNIMWGSNFVDSSKELYTHAKFLRRDYDAGKKLKVNKFNEFIQKYNNFIRDAGNISFM